ARDGGRRGGAAPARPPRRRPGARGRLRRPHQGRPRLDGHLRPARDDRLRVGRLAPPAPRAAPPGPLLALAAVDGSSTPCRPPNAEERHMEMKLELVPVPVT